MGPSNESYGAFSRMAGPLGIHYVPYHGNKEGTSFAAAGLCYPDQVSTTHNRRNGLGLNRSGFLKSAHLYNIED